MNKIFITGNLTRDTELAETSTGVKVCHFSVAVNRGYTNADGERETDFFNCVAWRALADNCSRYLRKGSKVLVSGTLQNRSYEDREGNKRTVSEIIASDVEFLSSRQNNDVQEPESQPQRTGKRPQLQAFDDDDDIPF